MTTIAFRDGVIAADSGVTYSTEAGGSRKARCRKLFRKVVEYHYATGEVVKADMLIGTAGESAPGLLFLDLIGVEAKNSERWDEMRQVLTSGEADFSVMVVTPDGVHEVDKWLREERVIEPFWAVGSGAKVALGAMERGASAREAVAAAKVWDPYTFGPTVSASLWFGSKIPAHAKMLNDVPHGTIIEIQAETA